MTEQTPIPEGRRVVGGVEEIQDSKGRWQPVNSAKPQDLLQDELVRKITGFARDLNAQIARFKGHSYEDVADFMALLAQEYEETRGGAGGNMTLLSHDGLLKVTVQVAKHYDYGPELQIAKGLVDECLTDWSADARPELRTIVERAFNTDQEGKINRDELLGLKKLDFEDERWRRAMKAISDAERAIGSKSYMRFYQRDTHDGTWQAITIDLAKA